MQVKMQVTGVEELVRNLEQLGKNTPELLKEVTTAGVQPVTDGLRAVISGLKVDNVRYVAPGKKRYLMNLEKKGLLESMGFSPVKVNDTVYDANAGVQGYNALRTTAWTRGIPNKMLLDAIDRGTSFRYAQPIFSKVKNITKYEAEKKMQEALEEEIMRLTNWDM